MPSPFDPRPADAIVRCGRLLYDRRYLIAAEGNLSVRLADGSFLITPAGACKGVLEASELVEMDLAGGLVGSSAGRPSSEWRMHAELYSLRPDVGAVCHAHPGAATAFACAHVEMPVPLLPEALLVLGDDVPLVPYCTPGTPDLAAALRERAGAAGALLLANHGVVTVGEDLDEAFRRMETVERLAEVALGAALLGGGVRLTRQQQDLVRKPRRS